MTCDNDYDSLPMGAKAVIVIVISHSKKTTYD